MIAINMKPLVLRPQHSLKSTKSFAKKETGLERRRRENIQRLRRKHQMKRKSKFRFWTTLEFIAISLMTTGLSVMAIKTAIEMLFKVIN